MKKEENSTRTFFEAFGAGFGYAIAAAAANKIGIWGALWKTIFTTYFSLQ